MHTKISTGLFCLAVLLWSGSSLSANVTPHTALEPDFFASSETFQLAKTCFLPDCDYHFNTHTTDNPKDPDGSEQGTDKRSCSDYGFVSAVPAGEECQAVTPDGTLRCYTGCKVNPDVWCPENGYAKECEAGWQPDSGESCPYDSSYFKCCNLCSDYPLSSIPEGYVENGSCESCEGTKYKIKPAPCDGFTTCDYGCELGAKECLSGELTKCSVCKKCPNRCSLASCPEGNICEKEDCSEKYCIVGCAIGYTEFDKYWCDHALKCFWPSGNKDCGSLGYVQSCPSGWVKDESKVCRYDSSYYECCNPCTGYTEKKIPSGYVSVGSCDGCEGLKYKISANPCDGYQSCAYGGKEGSESCLSGAVLKYKECQTADECNLDACPAENICKKNEATGKYCITGCASGYISLEHYWCNGALRCWWQ